MLKVASLQSGYDESMVLENIDMEVLPGSVVAVLGRNGVGKSTLMKSIIGLLPLAAGSIIWENNPIEKLPPEERTKRGMAYVPQGREIFPTLTVEENLLLGLESLPKQERKGIPEHLFEMFPVLKEMLHRKGGDLSGGQQQQLAIARALAGQPRLLLLDEPMEGIQPSIVQLIQQVISQIAASKTVGIVLVEHSLDVAFECADYYYVVDHGKIVAHGDIASAQMDEVKKYLVV
ncbi:MULTISPECIES: urea ABC transporter ATP-binding subunit UrtE [Bacillaceae]|uniref:urea ABC transporter ATP-binding subunit UrtE n=1 Tax=Bacillaceae TaxID=186817 RepID=UPI00101B6BD7|nr:urea ABC transporter ATP-binding subunit UrtE [Ectobacillus funiculus]